MGILNALSSTLFGLSSVTNRPQLYDYLDYARPLYVGSDKDVNAYLDFLVGKHSLSSIMVLTRKGTIVGRSSNSNFNDPAFVKQVFSFLENGLPQSDFIYIRSKSWYTFYTYNDFIFAIEAGDTLATPEVRAVAKDLVSFVNG